MVLRIERTHEASSSGVSFSSRSGIMCLCGHLLPCLCDQHLHRETGYMVCVEGEVTKEAWSRGI
jgi:hypothetical protein